MATAHTLFPAASSDQPAPEAEEQILAQAFADFGRVAASLEHSYSRLQAEVGRLRAELEASRRDLAHSLEENRRMRQHFHEQRESLRRRQALAEMSAVLAHEIRNPLGSLELFAGLLADAGLAPEPREWVEHLQAGLRTLAATVNNVLQFHSQAEPGFAPTDLGALLDWLEHFLHPLAQRGQVRIERTPALAGVWIAGDRHRLEQVLLNLALNSLQFMPGGGVLRLSGDPGSPAENRGPSLEISDTGSGIAAEDLDLVFAPGFSTRPGSPGLGLAVCKAVLEQHGGNIRVASSVGRGATFTVEFPPGECA
ncbi:MAG: ATP-binding protein [Terriglobales bacterium]